jgi:hypothetical protein
MCSSSVFISSKGVAEKAMVKFAIQKHKVNLTRVYKCLTERKKDGYSN